MYFLFLYRQIKDQSKKVANLKHKEQLEKSRNAQLMEEAKKREDNLNESSQQIKVWQKRRMFLPFSFELRLLSECPIIISSLRQCQSFIYTSASFQSWSVCEREQM